MEESDHSDEGFDDNDLAPDDDIANLISFANLENVVKHIIRKFKTIERSNESFTMTLQGVKRDLDTKATKQTVIEVSSDFGSKAEAISKAVTAQKETLINLDNNLERNRVMCNAIDKKLEAVSKEKAVQDRLLREIQDGMQDKVAVAELNMFEAKFAGYTTKLEHQEVLSKLSQYTKAEVSDRIADNIKSVEAQFDDYTRTARIEQQLQELRDWVSEELTQYAKARPTIERIEELQVQMKEQGMAFERVHSVMDDKLRGLSDRMTSLYMELSQDVRQCALAVDLESLQKELTKYALRAETEFFQQDCLPKLRFCVESIQAFNLRLEAQDAAIQRVDEVLLDKAGKYDIMAANSRIDECFLRETAMKEFQKMYERLEFMSSKLSQYIDGEEARLEQFKPPDYTPVFDDINSRIALKADTADIVEMNQQKANRIDVDELTKQHDIIHKQLEYLSVTNFEFSKLALIEARKSESKTIRAQQTSQVLMQSEYLWHWILTNEPPPNLETLKPPPALGKRGTQQDREGPGYHQPQHQQRSTSASADKDKRAMEEHRRMLLEKKLGMVP